MKGKPLKNNAKCKNEQGQKKAFTKGSPCRVPINKRMIDKAPEEK
jgi:hypothetical protein